MPLLSISKHSLWHPGHFNNTDAPRVHAAMFLYLSFYLGSQTIMQGITQPPLRNVHILQYTHIKMDISTETEKDNLP